MEYVLDRIFNGKKALPDKLLKFGFAKENEKYVLCKEIPDVGFVMKVEIDTIGNIETEIMDPCLNEPYSLHLVEGAKGAFVGKIKNFYIQTLGEIAENCFEKEIFKSAQSSEIIKYIRKKYGDNPEFLWQRFPRNAIWRIKDSRKWYAALLTVQKNKLGIESNDVAEVLNFKTDPHAENPVDFKSYFPAYHMNKKNWCSALLDASIPTEEIYNKIDASHRIVSLKKKAYGKAYCTGAQNKRTSLHREVL